MELDGKRKLKRKKEKLIEYNYLIRYSNIRTWKGFVKDRIITAILLIIPILLSIPIFLVRGERKEFFDKWCTEESKEYIILNKDQLVHDKSSTELVFLVKCKETGKVFDVNVTRGLFLSKSKGDRVWFKFPRHRFLLTEEEWNNLYPPGSGWLIFLIIYLITEGMFFFVKLTAFEEQFNRTNTYHIKGFDRGIRIVKSVRIMLYCLFTISLIISLLAIFI